MSRSCSRWQSMVRKPRASHFKAICRIDAELKYVAILVELWCSLTASADVVELVDTHA